MELECCCPLHTCVAEVLSAKAKSFSGFSKTSAGKLPFSIGAQRNRCTTPAMSKKTVDGDVLGNKWSLMAAKSQKILSSMMGPEPGPAPVENASKADEQEQDEDLRVNFGHDR
jgi:hypothetical protein